MTLTLSDAVIKGFHAFFLAHVELNDVFYFII